MPPTLFGGRLARFLDRRLNGTQLEVAKFAMYISFPIGYMYYFGTNLDARFGVPDYWPRSEQTHKIPLERDEIASELARLRARRLGQRADRLEAEGQPDEAAAARAAAEQVRREGVSASLAASRKGGAAGTATTESTSFGNMAPAGGWASFGGRFAQ